MADDEANVLAEAKKLPLAEQLEHKDWKVRAAAHEDVKAACERAFSSTDPILEQAGPLYAKSIGDTNANVMDKALDSLCSWLQKAEESQARSIVSNATTTIATKCLKARPATVSKATEACLLFAELEQADHMVESILKALSDKVPKVIQSALDILLTAVRAFGIRIIDPKPIIKSLPLVFAHSNAAIRDKAKELTVELAAIAGPSLIQSTLIDKMSDAMKKDVESSIRALPSKKKQPERYTRKEAAARAVMNCNASGSGDEDGGEGENDGEVCDAGDDDAMDIDEGIDAYDISDPVDILSQLPKLSIIVGDDSTPFWTCFESKKWNVRKGALDKIKDLAKVPRLAPGDYNDLCREIKKVLAKDANIPCATSAAEAIGALAMALRSDFTQQARQLCGSVLERFKEKNSSMSKAASESLRAMAKYCYSIGDVVDDLCTALSHKNPKVKADTLRLLCDMVDSAEKQQLGHPRVKDSLIQATVKLAPDADPGIREAAQSVLVSFALKLGSFSAIQPYLNALDAARSKSIEDAVVNAAKNGGPSSRSSGVAKSGAVGIGKKTAPALSTTAKGKSGDAAAPRQPPVPGSSSRRPPSSSSSGTATGMASGTSNTNRTTHARAATASVSIEQEIDAATSAGRLSLEEAEQVLCDRFGPALLEDLRSPQWQARLEAMNTIAESVQSTASAPDAPSILFCLALVPGWNEKNFQVLNKVFEVSTCLARDCPGYGKREAALSVEGACDKIHELKHRLQASQVLTAACEAVGPKFVAAYVHARASANKNPKVLSESLSWLATTVDEFGVGAVDLGSIIRWMLSDLGSPNAPVRNQAMAVLGRCHVQVGSGLASQLSEAVKPAQLTALEEVFRKNPKDEDYMPTKRASKLSAKKQTDRDGSGGIGIGIGGESLTGQRDEVHLGGGDGFDGDDGYDDVSAEISKEDLFPRTNISSELTASVVSRIGNANWKERNAALESIEDMLKTAGGRITPDVPPELFSELKGRLADTNRNLAARALLLLGKLADAIGAPFDKLARHILPSTLLALSDNKKQVRDAVITMLDSWLASSNEERLFPALADAIANPKCSVDGRVAALSWMTRVLSSRTAKKKSTRGNAQSGKSIEPAVVRAAAAACGDKSGSVREAGARLIAELVTSLHGTENGDGLIQAAVGALDASGRSILEPVIQKALAAASSSSSAAVASAPAAATSFGQKTSTSPSPAYRSSRPGIAAATTTTPAAPAAAFSIQDPRGDSPAILSMGSTGKSQRIKQFRPRPGKFEPPTPQDIDALEQLFIPVASDEFRSQLFGHDFKDHVKAADALAAAVPALIPEIVSSLDLIFRWCVIRMCDNNMQAILRVLEALRTVLDGILESGYDVNDAEAAVLLPAVVEKCGHNQDRVRGLYRDVLNAVCRVYSTPKVVDFVTQGLLSKNSRTRVECCEFISSVVDAHGASLVVGSKAKPMLALAATLKERDGTLRTAALAVIESVWAQESADTIWKLLGRLETREKTMIEDKIKRSTKVSMHGRQPYSQQEREKEIEEEEIEQEEEEEEVDYYGYDQHNRARMYAASQHSAAANSLLPSMLDAASRTPMELYSKPAYTPPNALDITPPEFNSLHHQQHHSQHTASILTPVPKQRASPSALPVPQSSAATPLATTGAGTIVTSTPHPHSTSIPPANTTHASVARNDTSSEQIPAINPRDDEFKLRFSQTLSAMATPSLPDAVDATKQLCSDMMILTQPPAPVISASIRGLLRESSGQLFDVVVAQLDALFRAAEHEAASAGVDTTTAPSSRGCKFALNVLLQSVAVPEVASGIPQATVRETISLLLCQLAGGLSVFGEEQTYLIRAINVLVGKLLDAADRTVAFTALLHLLRDPPSSMDAETKVKFNNLTIKCLIKLTKNIQESIDHDSLDVSVLLLNLHDFFMFLGVEEIRRRSNADDKPLRMVKTIIHEVCKVKGYGIYQYASKIPGRYSEHPPALFAYLRSNLASLEQAGSILPASEEDEVVAREAASLAEKEEREEEEERRKKAGTWGVSDPHQSSMMMSQAETRAHATKAEVKQRLKEIMTRLVSREKNQQDAAMVELYRLKREQPQYVERYIAGTSSVFRQFIDNGLAKLEAQGTILHHQYPLTTNTAMSSSNNNNGNNSILSGGFTTTSALPSPQQQQQNASFVDRYSDGAPHSESKIPSLKERLSQLRADDAMLSTSFRYQSTNSPAAAKNSFGKNSSSTAATGSNNGLSVEELSARFKQLKQNG